jgi:hypothetical protein
VFWAKTISDGVLPAAGDTEGTVVLRVVAAGDWRRPKRLTGSLDWGQTQNQDLRRDHRPSSDWLSRLGQTRSAGMGLEVAALLAKREFQQ